jgi:hypothetical protein
MFRSTRYSCPRFMDACLQPVDLLIALKVTACAPARCSVRTLERELGVSKSAAANSLRRLRELGLARSVEGGPQVNKLALRECLEHAVKWIAPARVGDFELGLPTSHSEAAIGARLAGAQEEVLVMPLAHGPVRGRAVTPLHPLAPAAAARDPKLHRLLALVDAFRIGRARDRRIAAEELGACL